jgi:hypothetical protein
MVIILFYRKPDAFLNPQFWAEDGTVFFKGCIDYGFKSITIPYAGYLHLVPRLIACAASLFPFSMTPTIYNFSALAAMLLVGGALFSSRCFIPFKPLLALSIVLVPHHGEVFMTITNLQWYLCFLLLILFCKEPPSKFYQYFLDYLIIILCGLTGPFIFFLLPLFIAKCFTRNSLHNYGMWLTALLCALIQGWYIFKTGESESYEVSGNINAWANLLGFRLFGQLFLGKHISDMINQMILAVLAVMTPIVLICLTSSKKQLYLTGLFLIFGIVIALSTLYKFRGFPEIVAYSDSNGERYFYIPYVMVMWSLAICLSSPNLIKWRIVVGLLLLILISSSHHFQSQAFVDYHWKEYSKKIESGGHIRIPINPPGWYIDLGFYQDNLIDKKEGRNGIVPKQMQYRHPEQKRFRNRYGDSCQGSFCRI